jgi:hypothetical protein
MKFKIGDHVYHKNFKTYHVIIDIVLDSLDYPYIIEDERGLFRTSEVFIELFPQAATKLGELW